MTGIMTEQRRTGSHTRQRSVPPRVTPGTGDIRPAVGRLPGPVCLGVCFVSSNGRTETQMHRPGTLRRSGLKGCSSSKRPWGNGVLAGGGAPADAIQRAPQPPPGAGFAVTARWITATSHLQDCVGPVSQLFPELRRAFQDRWIEQSRAFDQRCSLEAYHVQSLGP